MILEKFFTDKYDDELIFINDNITFGKFKDYVYAQKEVFEKSQIKNIAILCENYFDFAVNFFAAVFAEKQINLITAPNRLNLLTEEFILPEPVTKPLKGDFSKNIDPKDVMINFFTSGSTGTPKTIGKTLHNLEVEAITTIEEFPAVKECIVCSTTLSSHSYGIAFNFILPFYTGMKINQTRIEFPEQFPEKGKYILISTPSFVEKLVKYDYEFSNPPEIIFLAGAKLDDYIYEYLKQFSDVVDIYGSTETGNIAYKRGGSTFNVLKHVEVTPDEESKITVTSDFFPEGHLVLNDIIEMLSERQFRLKKRTDRIVKILEKRISLTEIENKLKERPDIEDACCYQDGDHLNCAVAAHCRELTGTILKKYMGKFVEITPKKWRFLDEIPKNVSGKTDYEKLTELFGLNLSLPFVLEKKCTGNSAEIRMLFKKDSNFFKGHFDIKPIVPGVVQLFFARYFAEDLFKIKLSSNNIKKVKFSNIINPDETVTLRIINKENSVETAYMTDDKNFSSAIFIKNED